MWHAGGNNDHIAFVELACIAAIDAAATDFVRSGIFASEHLAAGYKRGGAIDDVEDIGVSLMQFGSCRAGLRDVQSSQCSCDLCRQRVRRLFQIPR